MALHLSRLLLVAPALTSEEYVLELIGKYLCGAPYSTAAAHLKGLTRVRNN